MAHVMFGLNTSLPSRLSPPTTRGNLQDLESGPQTPHLAISDDVKAAYLTVATHLTLSKHVSSQHEIAQ